MLGQHGRRTVSNEQHPVMESTLLNRSKTHLFLAGKKKKDRTKMQKYLTTQPKQIPQKGFSTPKIPNKAFQISTRAFQNSSTNSKPSLNSPCRIYTPALGTSIRRETGYCSNTFPKNNSSRPQSVGAPKLSIRSISSSRYTGTIFLENLSLNHFGQQGAVQIYYLPLMIFYFNKNNHF